jgi:sugar phosphate permease
MDTPPKPKSLRILAFVTHATRGVVRDQRTRRRAMLFVIGIAALMVISGSTFLQRVLNPREHLILFLLFWLGCGWFTATAVLLALFDMLMVRSQARKEQRELREGIVARAGGESPGSAGDR